MGLLIFFVLSALGISFLCSLSEATILSLTRSQVALLVKKNRPSGRILKRLKENIDRPLAAILTLNTIANTIGAAGVGAQALNLWGQAWVAVVSAVLTLLILVFSEIIPKTLGVVYCSQLAAVTAYTIQGMIILTYPLVLVFQSLSRALARGEGPSQITREEIALIAELGEAEGAFHEKEFSIIRNLMKLHKIPIKDIMTPRTVVFMLGKDLTVKQVVDEYGPLGFSRVPICGDGPDEPAGLVFRHQIYENFRNGEHDRKLHEMAKPIHAMPESASVRRALNQFFERGEHIFLVVDEYGGTAGIITLEDAIETLLGVEIVDETDAVEDMRQLAGRLFQSKLRRQRF